MTDCQIDMIMGCLNHQLQGIVNSNSKYSAEKLLLEEAFKTKPTDSIQELIDESKRI
ncbi:hypothetical protein I2483_02955 [Sporosarcina sp. E16_3]|uniref:hypothetical protein n=1 Tax=Sporosarcina sp. E16_3 TaxID=2789293 RepID=UPI001A92D894|nr:hypothetical protein [Sporosarcina sp. E16_3]MBO0600611.1 hypothetical protein [Sporosarcina sp. E16_3]